MIYTDPSGEFIVAALIGVGIGVLTNGIFNSVNDVPFFYGAGMAGVIGGVSGVLSAGIGAVSTNALVQAGMHGVVAGAMSKIQGDKFIHGLYSGVASSLVSSALTMLSVDANGNSTKLGSSSYYEAVVLASGGLSGGISSSIAGGDFWSGARQGLITSGLNHLAHQMVENDDDVRINTKDKTVTVERTGDDFDRIFVDGAEVLATPRGELGAELRDNGFSISMVGPQGVGMGLTDLVLDGFEVLTGTALLKMGLKTVPKISSSGFRAMKVGDASVKMLESSAFFTKHLRAAGMNYSFGKKVWTLYKPASNMGTFLGRNSPIIGSGMMSHGGYNLYNGR